MGVLLLVMSAVRGCERQHGLAVKTWLDDDGGGHGRGDCAAVGDFAYARAGNASECPIQHYYVRGSSFLFLSFSRRVRAAGSACLGSTPRRRSMPALALGSFFSAWRKLPQPCPC